MASSSSLRETDFDEGLRLVVSALEKRHRLQRLLLLECRDAGEATMVARAKAGDAAMVCINSANGQTVLQYLDERMCVPRDMGRLAALEIRRLASNAKKARTGK